MAETTGIAWKARASALTPVILSWLSSPGRQSQWFTAREIKASLRPLRDCSVSEVRSLLQQLTDEGNLRFQTQGKTVRWSSVDKVLTSVDAIVDVPSNPVPVSVYTLPETIISSAEDVTNPPAVPTADSPAAEWLDWYLVAYGLKHGRSPDGGEARAWLMVNGNQSKQDAEAALIARGLLQWGDCKDIPPARPQMPRSRPLDVRELTDLIELITTALQTADEADKPRIPRDIEALGLDEVSRKRIWIALPDWVKDELKLLRALPISDSPMQSPSIEPVGDTAEWAPIVALDSPHEIGGTSAPV